MLAGILDMSPRYEAQRQWAHPRFARNPGTGEPVATATKLLVAEQAVYHDPEHPSAILLPVLDS